MAFGRESFSPLEIEGHRGRGYDGAPEDAIFHDILRVAGMGFPRTRSRTAEAYMRNGGLGKWRVRR
jgi:hypothetical protein